MHQQALHGAHLDIPPAGAALQAVDLPFLLLLADPDRIGRTVLFAQAAEDALLDFIFDLSPRCREISTWTLGIHEGGWLAEEALGNRFGEPEKTGCVRGKEGGTGWKSGEGRRPSSPLRGQGDGKS